MTGRPRRHSDADGAARLDLDIDAILDARPILHGLATADELELLATARLLHEALPRFHPHFGFEERLARRLTGRVGVERPAARFPEPHLPVPSGDGIDIELETAAARSPSRRRSLVAGGAIASGISLAIPLVGAALVAWRRSRPTEGIS